MSSDFPVDGVELTTLLVLSDVPRALSFYKDVLGATLYREYGTSAVLQFQGAWILLVTGGIVRAGKTIPPSVRASLRSAYAVSPALHARS